MSGLDKALCYRALQSRDARFDGRFFTGVVTTGIFCRPVCPAKTPNLENCIFLPSAAAAHQLGFRPCLRCRPELAPHLAGQRGTANTVSRALSLIAEGRFDEGGVDALAEHLGVGPRHLRRLFDEHIGASPISVVQTHRVLFAKTLITDTHLAMTDVALASGFGSVRRFNDAIRRAYGRPPSALRRTSPRSDKTKAAIVLKLPFAPPLDWQALLEFFAARAVLGIERVEGLSYARTFACDGAVGHVTVVNAPGKHHLLARVQISDVRRLGRLVVRLRRLFDLDAELSKIDEHLARAPALGRRVLARPGIRVPGALDPFELAVRTVLGQQVSVRAATTLATRLVARFGAPLEGEVQGQLDRLFPTPQALASADLQAIGLTARRASTLRALAQAALLDERLFEPRGSLEATVKALCELPGIGPWTAEYICMRAMAEPDAFPPGDLGLVRAMKDDARPRPGDAARAADAFRPWRAYAAIRYWTQP